MKITEITEMTEMTECPMELIEHYAQQNDLLVSDNLIWFATAIWNESINKGANK